MKLNHKFSTTAAFLLSAMLFAGCAGNAAPEESMPPESASPAPFSDSDISSGIQTGDAAEAAAALLGTWELDKAEVKVEDKEELAPAEVENTRTYIFNEDGTGSVQYPDWSDTFEYAIQGEYLTLAMDGQGTLEMYQTSFDENGALLIVRINNDGSLQDLRETFVHPEG
jgi:hypothetical protein